MSSSTKENAGNKYCSADDFSNLNQQPDGPFWPQQQPPLQRKQQYHRPSYQYTYQLKPPQPPHQRHEPPYQHRAYQFQTAPTPSISFRAAGNFGPYSDIIHGQEIESNIKVSATAAAPPPTQIPFEAALTPITLAAAAAQGDKQRLGSTCQMVTGSQRSDRYTYTDGGNKDGRGKIMIDTEIPLATADATIVEKEQSIVALSDQEVAPPPPQPFSHQAVRNVSKTNTIINDRIKLDKAIAASKDWKNSKGKEGPFYTYIEQEGKKRKGMIEGSYWNIINNMQ